MKKSLTIFITAILFCSLTTFAQDDDSSAGDKRNSLKANPLGLIVGSGKINYERKVNDYGSVQLGVSYFNFSADDFSLSGLGLIPEYRFYVTGEAINGFYLAPFFKYRNFTAKNDADGFKGALNIYGGGAKAGFNWLLGKKENFVIDLAFGGKYQDFNLKVKEGTSEDFTEDDLFQGFSPELHFAIGFAF